VRLCFDGVDAAFYCWVNGQLLGYSQDSRLPAEFDATAALRSGENSLAVQVRQRAAVCSLSLHPHTLHLHDDRQLRWTPTAPHGL
jgi:beta-galactosidase/beta-glucuronidase